MKTDAKDRVRLEGTHAAGQPVATMLAPLFHTLLGDPVSLPVRFWDGSLLGEPGGPATVVLRRPEALQRIIRASGELGFARAYVSGDLEVEGDLIHALGVLNNVDPHLHVNARTWVGTVRCAARLGVLGRAPAPPAEEAKLRGRAHTKRRDRSAIVHHYDVGNDFYRLVLGPTMVYSCGRFVTPESTLDEAQEAKCDLICRKLGLQPGMRLLDVGCGWGAMVCHAAQHYGVRAVGITLSPSQQALAAERAASLGLSDRVEIRLQDYRDLRSQQFDAICSIGMLEHVGRARMQEYSNVLAAVLRPGGRLLNSAITTPNGSEFGPRSFIGRYVFPDGDIPDLAVLLGTTQRSGLEIRDVESLREHYALTLRCWLANLGSNWDQATALAGVARSRIWRLYMSGSVVAFEKAQIGVDQVLAVKVDETGASHMPRTRHSYV